MPVAARAEQPISVGLVGFGLAGAVFHAPLIRAVPRLSLARVATVRRAAEAEKAGIETVPDADALIGDPSIDLIVIASPNHTHQSLAEAALKAGKHVVVDKPLALSAGEADALIALAEERDRVLTVFHNRRWDGDFLTVSALIEADRLGDIVLFQAFWDRYRPKVNAHWKEAAEAGGGLLNDLGPHMIDQVLRLFGPPDAVTADISIQRGGAEVDDYFDLRLDYGRRRVRLGAANLIVAARPRFEIFGTQGSFVKHGLDPQQNHLRDGLDPGGPGYGAERESQFGRFTGAGANSEDEAIPTAAGRWVCFYQMLADAIDRGSALPVDPKDARCGLALIDLARQSAREGRTLNFRPGA